MATIRRLHEDQNRAQGTDYALPQLFEMDAEGRWSLTRNMALAFIVEQDGKPVQAFYFELVPEVCFAGCDAASTAFARREIDRIAFLLRNMGFTGLNCKVPEHMAETIGAPLSKAGFGPDDGLAHFFKDLRLPASAGEEQEDE